MSKAEVNVAIGVVVAISLYFHRSTKKSNMEGIVRILLIIGISIAISSNAYAGFVLKKQEALKIIRKEERYPKREFFIFTEYVINKAYSSLVDNDYINDDVKNNYAGCTYSNREYYCPPGKAGQQNIEYIQYTHYVNTVDPKKIIVYPYLEDVAEITEILTDSSTRTAIVSYRTKIDVIEPLASLLNAYTYIPKPRTMTMKMKKYDQGWRKAD